MMSSAKREDLVATVPVHKKRKLNGPSSLTATNGTSSALSNPPATKNSRPIGKIMPESTESTGDLSLESRRRRPVEDMVSSSDEAESDTAPTENDKSDATKDTPVEAAAAQNEARKTFKDLGVVPELCDACEKLGYKVATPIQAEAIPQMLGGRDVIGLAETGSGKTAAFLLPILQSLLDKNQPFFALILAPTRELAFQISQAADALGSLINVKTATIVGGMDMVAQSIALGKKPHIVVATPGRLLDHLENTKGFSLRNLKYLILDEADRLLDLDFGPVIDKILKVLPRESRRSALFSATMSSKVESLQRASLSNPIRVSVSSSKYQTVATLLQSWLLMPLKHKDLYLVSLLTAHAGQTTIIFTRTVHDCQRLSHLLRALGFSALPLHGQLSQSARLGALGKFRARARDVLIATDVAARGLDVPAVDLVLNYDLPADSETYIHRVGRTARAGRSGKAVSFVTQYDVEVFTRIEHALGRKLPQERDCREEAMVFAERVGEAQRVAVRALRDEQEKRGGGGGKGRRGQKGAGGARKGRDEMDREEG